jgi:hypothetical protein
MQMIIWLLGFVLFLGSAATYAQTVDFSKVKTFGTIGKQTKILSLTNEVDLFNYSGAGALTHMWFGGAFKGVESTRIRVYVDQETNASIDMELYLGHGIGFGDEYSPWGTERIGKVGSPNSVYNTYRIPFGTHVRVTAQLAPDSEDKPMFWWIIRGSENIPVRIGGLDLPPTARLKLYKINNLDVAPLEEFAMCNVKGSGALYQVTMAAKGGKLSGDWRDLSYMEACVRAYIGGAREPLMLSSGLEDYFLGTYYFNKGRYATPIAGLTHFNKTDNEFSAYRFHEDDPVFFHDGLRLTCRCGEELEGKMLHNPPKTVFTTYVWLYQW